MYKHLNSVSSPLDIKKLSINELEELCAEIREAIYNRLSVKGGHFGPNFGIVEATVALHYVFNSPTDKLVFDVSHQCYPHKILTGRASSFINEEDFNKISGFTDPEESAHDIFNVGHTSTSISLASGLCKARDLKGAKENIIAIIGDGSLSGGEAFEGLNFASTLNSNLIIVVNDNDMSIAENHGGIYKNLKELRDTKGNAESNIFKSFGFDYRFVENGNDVGSLIEAFSSVKDINHPVIVHICTVKGKGYEPAEVHKEKYHSFGPFNKETGEPVYKNGKKSYFTSARDFAIERIKSDPDFAVICAGTPAAIGFDAETRISAGEQYIDVGIAEGHAVALASAMAKGGARPVFATYSSFLQRTYDQISQDLCLNNTPATLLVSNATIYGMKDKTHLGIFDIPLLSGIPNLLYLAPASDKEFLSMLNWSTTKSNCPVAIKMPGGQVFEADYEIVEDYKDCKYQITKKGRGVAVLALGTFYQIGKKLVALLEEKGISATLVNPKFVTGVDGSTLDMLKESHSIFVTLEDGVLDGGFGEKVASYLGKDDVKVYSYGFKREFIDRYSVNDILEKCRLTPEQIAKDIL